jgi:hypothetical protein
VHGAGCVGLLMSCAWEEVAFAFARYYRNGACPLGRPDHYNWGKRTVKKPFAGLTGRALLIRS